MNRPDPLEPPKPVSEMTLEERHEYVLGLRGQVRAELRELRRPQREKLLRQGRGKPRNQREWTIFAAVLLKDKQDDTGSDGPIRQPPAPGPS